MSDPIDPVSYGKPSGGWGALAASLRHVAGQKNALGTTRALLAVNQKDGFDCPGCAWPEGQERSSFEFCENGVKAVAWETTGLRVDPDFFARYPVAKLMERSDHWLESQGRLTHPMVYNAETGHYQAIDWAEALGMIGGHLKRLGDPDKAVFYTSGRTSNEAAFLYQLFGRLYGTNNFPDCSNMCHESSGTALIESVGVGKGTVRLSDFEKADAIFILGQNPGTNHPRMLGNLQKAAQRGARIVAINPLLEPGLVSFIHPQQPLPMLTGRASAIASLYLQPLIGGDLALLTGMAKLLLEAEDAAPGRVLDRTFIDEQTSGSREFFEQVRAADWGVIQKQSGLSLGQIRQAADVYLRSSSVIFCWAMGLTQHKHAVPTIQMIVNLLLMRGNLGRPGAGLCPVRGHSNVQGDRTMGIIERPGEAFLKSLGQVFAFEPPRGHGLDTMAAIHAMHEGRAKVFFGLGGNFAAATPDSDFTWAALRRCELTVHVSTKLNRSHLVHGRAALILPTLGRSELDVQAGGPQFVTVEDSMGLVHASTGRATPAGEHLMSEPAIIAALAEATLGRCVGGTSITWRELAADYGEIRSLIERTIPGFGDYNARAAAPGGFELPNNARDRKWATADGKARFIGHAIPDLSLPAGQLRLMTIRSHDQFNTTIYGLDDRYRGIRGNRRVIFLNPQDMADRSIEAGAWLDMTSHWPGESELRVARGFIATPCRIPQGCAAAYFPETNVLVTAHDQATGSRTPLSKFIPITLEPGKEFVAEKAME